MRTETFISHSISFTYVPRGPRGPITRYPVFIPNKGYSLMSDQNYFNVGTQSSYTCINIPGHLHNENGPAIVNADGDEFYYLEGVYRNYKQWKKERSKLGRLLY
jgi:hypothetical protein